MQRDAPRAAGGRPHLDHAQRGTADGTAGGVIDGGVQARAEEALLVLLG